MSAARFSDRVAFDKEVQFSNDSAGYAVIKKGSRSVSVRFDHAYQTIPVVTAGVSLQYIKDEKQREATEELLLVSEVKFIISHVSAEGFEIKMEYAYDYDIPFS